MTRMQIFVLGSIAASLSCGPVWAQGADDQAACREDVVKHCVSAIGNGDEMKKCLVSNRDKLNATCKKVVEAKGG